jgi:hypothetical protein
VIRNTAEPLEAVRQNIKRTSKRYFQHSNSNHIFSGGGGISKSLDKRRKLPSHEKVRSTTHRFGRTAHFPSIFSEIRVIATFCVVFLHSAAPLLYKYEDLPETYWMIGNIYDFSS